MSLLNQICRQVTREINKSPSKLFPEGITLPPDLIEIIVFEYLLPEFWVVPWTLQQDICLLKGNSIYSMPPSIGRNDFHGEWNIVEGQGMRVSTMPEFPVKALNDSHHRFKTSWSSQEASSVYGQGHEEILKKFTDQGNWCKVKILNYMRSVECPVLCTNNTQLHPFCAERCRQVSAPDKGSTPDYMEMRELTEEDVRDRGIGSFEATRKMDQFRLEEVLDEIIVNDVEMRWTDGSYVVGGSGGIIWHPTINGNGYITFTTR
jgi:hypothetical protein